MNKTKKLNREAMVRNINGLSLGDKAYCGPYGTITCTRSATGYLVAPKGVIPQRNRGARRFKVANSQKLRNGGNWTMAALRKAIFA